MEIVEREGQVRRFVDEVWNGKNYAAAADLYSEEYVNMFGSGPSAKAEPIRRYHQALPDLHWMSTSSLLRAIPPSSESRSVALTPEAT